MNTLQVELPADMQSFVDKKVSQGEFSSASALVQQLLATAMEIERRKEIERKLMEAVEEEERGLGIPWNKDRFNELLREHQDRMAAKKRADA